MNFLNSINKLKDKLTPNKKSTEVLNDINVNYNYLSEESLTNLEEVKSPVKKRYGLRPQIKINYKDLNSSIEEKKMEEVLKKLRAGLKSEQKYRQTFERELNSQKTESLTCKI
jgi:paraquat-inducible protein B